MALESDYVQDLINERDELSRQNVVLEAEVNYLDTKLKFYD